MKRKQEGKAKFICYSSKDEFVKNVQSQVGFFNSEHKADFIIEIKDGNLSIGLGRTGHGSGLWYEPTIAEKNISIIIDGAINDVSLHDDKPKWWQNLIMWIFILIPLYVVLSPFLLFRLIFSPIIKTPEKQLKRFMVEYMNCIDITNNTPGNFHTKMTVAKKEVYKKENIKQNYKRAFAIVKKCIDVLDPMGLFEMGCPPDEYECEVAEILTLALKTTNVIELADWIIKVFDNAFNEHNLIKKPKAIEAAIKIIDGLTSADKFYCTYILTKEQLNGTCYYEFYLGKFEYNSKHWSESSIYFDKNGISIFALFLKNFDSFGITVLSEKDSKDFIENLICLQKLLNDGKTTLEALKDMGFYKTINANSLEQSIVNAEISIVKNTAIVLADWLTVNLDKYKIISILGI